jgi:hypothetical protein
MIFLVTEAWAKAALLQDIANSSYWQLRTCTPHMIIIIQI